MSFVRNKTLCLTGASNGIGQALAFALAGAGARLVLNARSLTPLKTVRDECRRHGSAAEMVPGNIGDDAVARKLVQAAVNMGGPSEFGGFIHAAGMLCPGPHLWELPPEDFHTVLDANLMGAYLLVRHAVPHMLQNQTGLAVFFGSGAAQITQPGIAAYCVAKAGEEHLMRQLSVEAPSICTFVYRPGTVDTRMQTQARESQGGGAEALRKVFVSWKEKGELVTPEKSAQGLLRALEGDPWLHHGSVLHLNDVE